MLDEADAKAAPQIGQIELAKHPVSLHVLPVLGHDILLTDFFPFLFPSNLNPSKKWSPNHPLASALTPSPRSGPLGAFFSLSCCDVSHGAA